MQTKKAQGILEITVVIILVSLLGFFALKPIAEKVKSSFIASSTNKNSSTTTVRHQGSEIIVETKKQTGQGNSSHVEVSGTNALILAANNKAKELEEQNRNINITKQAEAESIAPKNSRVVLNGQEKTEEKAKEPEFDFSALQDLMKGLTNAANSAMSTLSSIADSAGKAGEKLVSGFKGLFD